MSALDMADGLLGRRAALSGGHGLGSHRGSRSCAQALPLSKCALQSTRRLWEAAERCQSGEAVVGVVGAAHVPAIRRDWARAGAPEVACKARRAASCCGYVSCKTFLHMRIAVS